MKSKKEFFENDYFVETFFTDRRVQTNLHNLWTHRKKTIGVIGTHHKVGTSHVARGILQAYRQMGRGGPKIDGPEYRSCISGEGIFVRDLGVIWNGFAPQMYDRTVVVLGSRFWEKEKSLSYIESAQYRNNCIFVCSGVEAYQVKELCKEADTKILYWAYEEDTYVMTNAKWELMMRLMEYPIESSRA